MRPEVRVVPGIHFVGALAVQHDRHAPGLRQPHQLKPDERGRRVHRLVVMPHRRGQQIPQLTGRRVQLVEDGAGFGDRRVDVRRFAELLGDVGEGLQRVGHRAPAKLRHHRDDGVGVDPARETDPDGHVAPHAQPHRVFEQLAECGDRIGRRRLVQVGNATRSAAPAARRRDRSPASTRRPAARCPRRTSRCPDRDGRGRGNAPRCAS